MYNNWFIEEKMLQARHNELLREAEEIRLLKKGGIERLPPLHARTLSRLGDHLVKAGFWLQDRYGSLVDFSTLELDDPYWK